MSTSVVLSVTPIEPVHPDRFLGEIPSDIAATLAAAGQLSGPGLWCPRNGPVRLLFQLRGADRVSAGRRLADELRTMGYEADVSFSR